jgi:hypothetical protein
MFDTDWAFLGDLHNYYGGGSFICVRNANGGVTFLRSVYLRVRLVHRDGSPWSSWWIEDAIVREVLPGRVSTRLSGKGLAKSNLFYIGVAPGAQVLSVTTTKGGMSSQLP